MVRETKIKIIGTGIFIILLLGIAYLVYHSNKIDKNEIIESVKVTGNRLLSENDYLTFTRLSELSNKNKFSLPVIKSRFEKHPYVLKADVKFISEKKVKVFLIEKRIYGVIIRGSEALFVAEGFQVLPVFPNTKVFDFPVISNIDEERTLKPLKKFRNKDIVQAFKIIDAIHITSEKLWSKLSEINFKSQINFINENDIVLTISGINPSVIFGRGNEASKIVGLETLLKGFSNDKNFLAESDYIDLRFNQSIYIGNTQRVEL